MPKETRLDDDAQIYHPHSKQTEKEKLKEMSFQGKLTYIWEYYKIHILAAIAVIALISYFIYTALHPAAKTQFYAAFVNNTINENVIEQYSTDFTNYLQLDPKKENVFFNTSFSFFTEDQYSASMKSALVTYISAGEIDAIIAPESLFHDYAYYGYFSKLSDQLPTDIYSSLTDKFYITDLEGDKDKDAYGIYLTDTKLFKDNANNTDPYILGIVGNSKHEENTVEFIRYLFDEK